MDTEGERNYLNVIDVTSKGLDLKIFRSEKGGAFGEMQDWKADFDRTDIQGRLVLGEWYSVKG